MVFFQMVQTLVCLTGSLVMIVNSMLSQRLIQRWNGTAGAMFEIDRSWEVLFEFGFGERKSAMGSLGYRF